MSNPNWVVNDSKNLDNCTLRFCFEDRIVKVFDCEDFFAQAHIFADTVAWNDKIDIAPEYLY